MTENLKAEDRNTLLKLARNSIVNRLRGEPTPKPDPKTLSNDLQEDGAAFVTLHMRGTLRGCIGSLTAREPLYRNVINNALNAAFSDPRFPPVSLTDMDYVDIEISVLTKPRRIASLDEFTIGQNGIILDKGIHRAVFLPQVAPEQGWNLETMLTHLSLKAGLPPDGWKANDVRFEVFEAIVFGETEGV
jgi:AmmeMemoRadiSam system protein A